MHWNHAGCSSENHQEIRRLGNCIQECMLLISILALKPTDLNSECYALELSLVDCISDFLNPPSSDRIVDINL